MIKILVTGPESSGKSFLVRALAAHFNADYIEEYAREYLSHKKTYNESDLLQILHGQIARERAMFDKGAKLLFCDTGPEVIKIWSQVKYSRVAREIEEIHQNTTYSLTLLCEPNIDWEPDSLRENPDNRYELHALYLAELENVNARVEHINTPINNRVDQAIELVTKFLSTMK